MNIFQESIDPVTKRPVYSMRRVLAFLFALFFPVLSIWAFSVAEKGWQVFIPAGVSFGAVIFLLFFTTWSEIKGLIEAAKGKES